MVFVAGDPAGRTGVVPGLLLQDVAGHPGLQPGAAGPHDLR